MDINIYEAHINKQCNTLYISDMKWEELFSSLNPSVFVQLKKYGKDQEVFCQHAELIEFIQNEVQEWNEYHVHLSGNAEINFITSSSFILRHDNVKQFIYDNFNSTILNKLTALAKQHAGHMLTIIGDEIIESSEEISGDIKQHLQMLSNSSV